MLRQYWQIKADYPDPNTILFFRLGDFYEMFYDDAVVAADILEITLTTRNKNDANPIPLCGFPYHSAEGYIAKLIAAGKKVAICEQVEDPKTAKGVVKREVIRVITPGAVFSPESLSAQDPNHLLAIIAEEQYYGLAVVDVSTGIWRGTQLQSWRAVLDEIERIEPREVVTLEPIAGKLPEQLPRSLIEHTECLPEQCPDFAGIDQLREVAPLAIRASAALWHYLQHTKLATPALKALIAKVEHYAPADFMVIDDVTKRNLELTRTGAEQGRHGSLLWLLDQCCTSMGSRCMKQWLYYPLRNIAAIEARHHAVNYILNDLELHELSGSSLTVVSDIERIAGRVVTGSAGPRDLNVLRDSLRALPDLQAQFANAPGLLGTTSHAIDPCADLATQIADCIADDPPVQLKDGGIIREGFDPELDELRALQHEGKNILASLEAKERAATGISSLKIRYNKVFGYYLEVTHTHKDKVPSHYIRKQTLTNAERFITEELKTLEEKILSAKERCQGLEQSHFTTLRQALATHVGRIKQSASCIATLDCLRAFATTAREGNYCCPTLSERPILDIREGRHPVIERLLTGESFIPNDCLMGGNDPALLMITGPNMAGKSTVMRQAGVITLLAHIGSFVPATQATIGLTDRIFTRVGANDNMLRGQSTFMVEMAEVATILHEATEQSLLLIDELGRGTSTYDGISIAWSVTEYLHDHTKARTLFATHYHELSQLADDLPGVANYSMAVKEWNDQIIFLRKLVSGAADRSYGIEVARLAGLPESVTRRARTLLSELESDQRHPSEQLDAPTQQCDLFGADNASHPAIETLRTIDPLRTTPLEALQLLTDLSEQSR